MKQGTTGRKMGSIRSMEGFHVDGSPLQIKIIVRAPCCCHYRDRIPFVGSGMGQFACVCVVSHTLLLYVLCMYPSCLVGPAL